MECSQKLLQYLIKWTLLLENLHQKSYSLINDLRVFLFFFFKLPFARIIGWGHNFGAVVTLFVFMTVWFCFLLIFQEKNVVHLYEILYLNHNKAVLFISSSCVHIKLN